MKKTAGGASIAAPSWWGEGNADERRVRDDLESGRLHLRSAYRSAKRGLELVDQGDIESARTLYETAKSYYIDALEAQLRPSDLANLGRSAATRGRPRKEGVAPAPKKKRGRPRKK
ncbi:hypothetical protein [Methylosinus sp. R-45379]|uniref:hypothetical protein n=2 Tax=unclassified Methylosinus TaxID=2624500 RepID=UPI0018DB3BC2|nr:hypothetical protein [Methylosinus sp. R-45379]